MALKIFHSFILTPTTLTCVSCFFLATCGVLATVLDFEWKAIYIKCLGSATLYLFDLTRVIDVAAFQWHFTRISQFAGALRLE